MTSRAVLIAVGEYAESTPLEGYPSIGASAAAYDRIISRDPWWAEHGTVEVLTREQTGDQAAVLDAVERAARDADSPDDRLLVVYLGHGTFWTDQNAGEVHLAAARSRPDRPYTWVSQNALYRAMRRSGANLKVLVADACHSNKLTGLESGRPSTPGQRATCVISAAGSEDPIAWAQPCPELADDEELAGCTPFSGHLLRLVRDGSAAMREDLPLPTLHHLLRTEMDACAAGHALPEIMSTGWTFTATLFANRRRGLPPAPAPVADEEPTALGILRGGRDTLTRLADDPARAAEAMIDVSRRRKVEGSVTNAQDVLLATLRDRPDGLATYLATLHQGREEEPTIPALVVELIRRTHEYLAELEPDHFARMIEAMRAAGHEGMALEVLRDFGLHSEPRRLVDLTSGFEHSDRSFVLTAAALGRSIDDAATLVAQIFTPGDSPMRDTIGWHIAIQLSDQRLVPDVARFIHRIRRWGNDELADWMLLLFGRSHSDRPAYDKAMLYFALRHHGLMDDAETLLGMTLDVRNGRGTEEQPRAASADPTHDLLAAFQHLSPEPVVERWFGARFADAGLPRPEQARTASLAAGLLLAFPASNARLLDHVARHADARSLVAICADLALHGQWRLVDDLRDRAAEREEENFLIDLLRLWDTERDLAEGVGGLVTAVITGGGGGGSRPATFLRDIAEGLDKDRTREALRRSFRYAAATEVAGRDGDDLVRLLRDIPSAHQRARAERTLGRRLALALLDGQITPERLAGHLRALADDHLGLAVASTCRELSDPAQDKVADPLVDTALALSAQHMGSTAWYLLERFLENEQRISPDEMVTVVARLSCGGPVTEVAESGVRGAALDTRLLLRATVGRWTDARLRDETVAALRAAGLAQEARWAVAALR